MRWGHDTLLTAIVMDASKTHVRVVFDCDGQQRSVSCDKVSPNTTVHDEQALNSMIGKTLHMPRKLWPKTLVGYEDVKQVGKYLTFRVLKRYHKGTRFSVSSVSKKTNRPLSKCEPWTLTYQQAACFLKKG